MRRRASAYRRGVDAERGENVPRRSVPVGEIAALSVKASVFDAALKELDWVVGNGIWVAGGGESKRVGLGNPKTWCNREAGGNGSASLARESRAHDEKAKV